MKIEIIPKKLKGSIDVIASKSCLHRAIIAASLSDGISTINNVLFSSDVKATINSCIKLGADIKQLSNSLIIKGTNQINNNQTIDCIESGSTLRFLIPIFLTSNLTTKFIGANSLFKRPLDIYFDIFNKQNIEYTYNNNLEINGQLKPGIFHIDGNVSSQFITGLLFSLPFLKTNSILYVNNLESKGYIDLTIDILEKFGIKIINNNYKEFVIEGNQKYKAFNYTAEADFSQASFFIVANELNNDISINNLNKNSLQPDKKIFDDIKKIKSNLEVDLSENPDCGPILSVLACLNNTKFINCSRLRIKESDRIEAMKVNLNKLGAKVTDQVNIMNFIEVTKLNGDVYIDAYNDHRVCMAIAIASTICDKNIIIEDASCVNKSYPNFWDDFKKLGGEFYVK